jgi:biopolymer transport protein ExbB/TolQ
MVMIWLMVVMAALVAALIVAVIALAKRVAELEGARARVQRMSEAVTLLSETAEAGFAAVAQEIEKLQRYDVRPAVTRTTVARRVTKASSQGERVEEIARREALSEGEIRLHLALAEQSKKGTRRASLRA